MKRFWLSLFLFAAWAAQAATNTVSVTLVWDANTESDLAGYIVHYGPASGVYTNVYTNAIDVITISNLLENVVYYFVVTAYNTSGLESEPSNEVVWPRARVLVLYLDRPPPSKLNLRKIIVVKP